MRKPPKPPMAIQLMTVLSTAVADGFAALEDGRDILPCFAEWRKVLLSYGLKPMDGNLLMIQPIDKDPQSRAFFCSAWNITMAERS